MTGNWLLRLNYFPMFCGHSSYCEQSALPQRTVQDSSIWLSTECWEMLSWRGKWSLKCSPELWASAHGYSHLMERHLLLIIHTLFSYSVVSDCLWPPGLQCAKLPFEHSLGLEWKLTFFSPVATAEFSKFSGILTAAL